MKIYVQCCVSNCVNSRRFYHLARIKSSSKLELKDCF